ncbi:MAG: polysaccharide pyruvyl transferase CsaB [Prochlorothrix sp.]|nr:polysaccharide pyruvyl transferase CsaB [Prochlorothrix sp.]
MRVVLCGYYGKGNGGDEALLATLLQMLPTTAIPVVLSGNPLETHSRYNVEAIDRFSAFGVLRALRSSEAFIFGGGSLMQDSTSFVSLLYYAGLMGLAQRLNLRTIAWAQGIGPLRHAWSRWLTRQVFRHCQGVSVRDGGSAKLLTQWQVPYVEAPDPVWALASESVMGLSNLPSPRIAVNLRPHPLLTEARLHCLAQAIAALQTATGASILLVPFQPQTDRQPLEVVARTLVGQYHWIEAEHPQQLKGIFQGVEMTIAMRLHGLIMALAEGCRCVGLSYDPKVTYLMQSLELPGYHLAQLPPKSQDVSWVLLQAYANGQALSRDRLHSLRDRALMHQDLLSQVLLGLNYGN